MHGQVGHSSLSNHHRRDQLMSQRRPALDTQLIVRMPKALRDQLEERAAEEDRTVAAEVRHALKAHLAPAS